MTLQSEDMGKLVAALVDAVEGPPGYGTLRNADGVRLKDHPAWVSVYLAANAFRPAHREAQPESDGGGEGVPVIDPAGGWIVSDSNEAKWRTWKDGFSAWTERREEATRYARREDAEAVHGQDEDAWLIKPFSNTRAEAGAADLRGYRDELLKIAESLGEPDDPFAAWESLEVLLATLREVNQMTDPDDPNSYRADDPQGCLDTVHSTTSAALASKGV